MDGTWRGPEYFARKLHVAYIHFLNGWSIDNITGGDKLKHIGVFNIDFISSGGYPASDSGALLAHTIIEVNFRE